jgi:hypothetical protein
MLSYLEITRCVDFDSRLRGTVRLATDHWPLATNHRPLATAL